MKRLFCRPSPRRAGAKAFGDGGGGPDAADPAAIFFYPPMPIRSVSDDWVKRSIAYFDHGYDAVAGLAVVHHTEWQALTTEQRARLRLLRKYQALISYLRLYGTIDRDCWPRHDYEGGASIALTLRTYRAVGGCPPLPVGEDRALFEEIRRKGGFIRHALDVKVFTSGPSGGQGAGWNGRYGS